MSYPGCKDERRKAKTGCNFFVDSIISTMPLAALFIMFEFIIHNAVHPNVRSNLILLDIASGHFSLVEHASNGAQPTGYLSEFADIAKGYVRNLATRSGSGGVARIGNHERVDSAEQRQLLPSQISPHLSDNTPVTTDRPLHAAITATDLQPAGGNHNEISESVLRTEDRTPGTGSEISLINDEVLNDPEYVYYPTPDSGFMPLNMQMFDFADTNSPFGFGPLSEL
jgi:hypothetical protein